MNFYNSIVGALGRGPKYLSDEYAVMDTRYWPLDDPTVAWISYVELAIMIPLCFAWYAVYVHNVDVVFIDPNTLYHASAQPNLGIILLYLILILSHRWSDLLTHNVVLWSMIIFRYRGIVQDKWYRHYFALLATTFQVMGCIIYIGAEWHVNFDHLPTHVNRLASYNYCSGLRL